MKTRLCILLALAGILAGTAGGADQRGANPNVDEVLKAVRDIPSLYLTVPEKEGVARTFLKLVNVRSPSGQEEALREMLRSDLAGLHAVEVAREPQNDGVPKNLVMEFPAAGTGKDRPGILLNAHLDTIDVSAPERLRFDAATADFYHADEGVPGKPTSFGADDKAGIATILGSLSVLQHRLWPPHASHRRIVVALTAAEEKGCVGARYLKEHHPAVFDNLDLAVSFDGPIDFRTEYPAVSFVVVVSEQDAQVPPYRRVLDLVAQVAQKKNARFARTELGLGMGDFAQFPAAARSGLHLRSPQRGFHRQERVKLVDLVNHIDLLCYLLLEWDQRRELK